MSSRRASVLPGVMALLSGCAGSSLSGQGATGGWLSATSQHASEVRFDRPLRAARFLSTDDGELHVVASDCTFSQWLDEQHGADSSDLPRDLCIAHVEVHWIPRAGRTPVDPEATNATIRMLVRSGGEIGFYGGAGFVEASGEADDGETELELTIVDSDVRMLYSTAGFRDPITPALITGHLTARRDNETAQRARRELGLLSRNAQARITGWDGREAERTGLENR